MDAGMDTPAGYIRRVLERLRHRRIDFLTYAPVERPDEMVIVRPDLVGDRKA
ncbi:hypothetical protein [Kitasatospora acidiphila]|uniref:hypothetical protein n=1 Tax=Kitasatospora acidiphila TaxID=2567942 RepID=UPI003C7388E8